MAEHESFLRSERLYRQYDTAAKREMQFLDLVFGDEVVNEVPFERRGELFISAGEAYSLIEETHLGKLLVPQGEPITRARVRNLIKPGMFGTPTVEGFPDRAYWRAYADQINPEDPDSWSRTLGIVFEFDTEEDEQGNPLPQLVTGRQEVGILMISGGMQMFSATGLLVNGAEFLVEEPCLADVSPAGISALLVNMAGLIKTGQNEGFVTPPELAGIDLTGFPATWGDKLEL